MDFIARYEHSSGQRMGRSKCNYFWRQSMRRNDIIEHHTGFSQGSWPMYYLGAPIAPRRFKGCYIRHLLEKIRRRIDGWCYRFLSMAGRLTLIKNVLCSIPLHILTVMKVPLHIIHDINRLLRDFYGDTWKARRNTIGCVGMFVQGRCMKWVWASGGLLICNIFSGLRVAGSCF